MAYKHTNYQQAVTLARTFARPTQAQTKAKLIHKTTVYARKIDWIELNTNAVMHTERR